MESNELPGEDIVQLPTGIYDLTIESAYENEGLLGILYVVDHFVLMGGAEDPSLIDENL
jgi:hypothetical protein